MERAPKRIIEAATIERIGVVTAQHLLSMSDIRWGLIRDQITDRRNGDDGLVAKCTFCESPVFIRGRKLRGVARPHFQHYSGSDPTCIWYAGGNAKLDAARAAQYQGRQESKFHRAMCEQIAELVSLDDRYISHTVDEYLPPTENAHGRFPDVYVEWADYGAFAVEFQMSGTFQTEISGRCKHYEREGIPLLWILFGLDTAIELPQNIIDVIRRHRGNAFMLDPLAVEASREQKTLVLSCYLRKADGKLDAPKLVRFDELTVPKSKLPYHEDMIVGPRQAEIDERRKPWFNALDAWQKDRSQPLCGLERPQSRLVAAAFSLVATATGNARNYASNHPNISAMLNTYLSTEVLSPYVDLLTHLIENTAVAGALKPTVRDHLAKYRDADQAKENSSEWQLIRDLLPEVFDPLLREEFSYLDALPNWAMPNHATA